MTTPTLHARSSGVGSGVGADAGNIRPSVVGGDPRCWHVVVAATEHLQAPEAVKMDLYGPGRSCAVLVSTAWRVCLLCWNGPDVEIWLTMRP